MTTPTPTFTVERLSFATLTELPRSWQPADYRALLGQLNFDSPEALPEAELKEMCQMALTDLEPREAAVAVLTYLFPEELTAGQIENLAHQIQTERLWEENPELPLHRGFYQATQLLYEAFNGSFPSVKAVEFQVKCTAASPADLEVFGTDAADRATAAAPLLRLLAVGLPDNALLNRLFSDHLAGEKFTEAASIVWELRAVEKTTESITFDVVSSAYWLEDFKYADAYPAPTHADAAGEEAE
ncbi:hypothetical protein [Hymenobacter sp. UYCo722]|uniref:hypothetical protein n=1 Tax=Hymenobacter sp. UYCo722 TaxID=3156335 RepID=UPI0033912DDE